MGRPGTYLCRPKGTPVWHVRFQYPAIYPGDRKVQKVYSLRTTDRVEAVLRAQEHIAAHLIYLRELREEADPDAERFPVTTGKRLYEPGPIELPCGTPGYATKDRVFANLPDGKELNEPNREVVGYWTRSGREARIASGSLFEDDMDAEDLRDAPALRPASLKPRDEKDRDNEIFERWVEQGKKPRVQRDAKLAFELFKKLTGGKRFDQSGYAEGKMLADHLFAAGDSYQTVEKKIGYLRAMVNVADRIGIFDGKRNPFSHVMRDKTDEDGIVREPFNDDDMDIARSKGPAVFDDREWLLWVLLASTGMRLEEAVTIDREYLEKSKKCPAGIRYVIIGTKTPQSKRRVAFPECVLPLLPKKITGPLFPGWTAPMMSKRMNRRIKQLGIKSDAKVLHSLRHRAKDRLRAESIATDMQEEVLGHETKTVAKGYGFGYPMSVLKPIIDLIGLGPEPTSRTS